MRHESYVFYNPFRKGVETNQKSLRMLRKWTQVQEQQREERGYDFYDDFFGDFYIASNVAIVHFFILLLIM